MIRIIDRYLVRIFIRAFLICLSSFVGLYIVIDAFCNLDEFFERSHGFLSLLAVIGQYYGYRISAFFDQLSSVVTTLSVLFTLSWVQRNNELTPLSAAGVSYCRIIAPLFICALGVCGMTSLNQELIIPKIAEELQKGHGENRREVLPTYAKYDRSGFLLDGRACVRSRQTIQPAFVTFPSHFAGFLVNVEAIEAKYVPPDVGQPSGGWLLKGVSSAPPQAIESVLEPLADGRYFLHTSLTFDQMSRRGRWFEFLSTAELQKELRDTSNASRTNIAVMLHTRLTRPLFTVILLLLGIPFILRSGERRVGRLMGSSLVLGLAFQSFSVLCQRWAEFGHIAPALAAWLPILIFGSLAVAMLDVGITVPVPRVWTALQSGSESRDEHACSVAAGMFRKLLAALRHFVSGRASTSIR